MKKYNSMLNDGSYMIVMCSMLLSLTGSNIDGFFGGFMIGLSGVGFAAGIVMMSKKFKLNK